jgi:hypothetical protein
MILITTLTAEQEVALQEEAWAAKIAVTEYVRQVLVAHIAGLDARHQSVQAVRFAGRQPIEKQEPGQGQYVVWILPNLYHVYQSAISQEIWDTNALGFPSGRASAHGHEPDFDMYWVNFVEVPKPEDGVEVKYRVNLPLEIPLPSQ